MEDVVVERRVQAVVRRDWRPSGVVIQVQSIVNGVWVNERAAN